MIGKARSSRSEPWLFWLNNIVTAMGVVNCELQRMKLNTLADLLHHELKDLYSAENQLVKALPKMAKAATNSKLKAAFQSHLEQTKGQVERLDEIAKLLEKSLTGHKCKAMEGLVEEGADLIAEDADENVRDAGLIGAAQRVEHYEIAGYGTARTLAEQLGHDEIAELLEETLDEEKETNESLTELATTAVNADAE
jgi:ferritin-like metal-binding protein YciE